MFLRHKGTGWEGSVDDKGWETIKRAKLDKNYEIITKKDNQTENVELPIVKAFKEGNTKLRGNMQKQQEAETNKAATGEQAAGKAE